MTVDQGSISLILRAIGIATVVAAIISGLGTAIWNIGFVIWLVGIALLLEEEFNA
jgi:type IV secretory pathway TrbD component